MQCRINRSLILSLGILACFSVRADFNEATRSYLLGDFEKARYEALIAATDGKPEAQMLLGQLYFNGEGVEKDIKAAMYWYEKAATQGFADAQYRLGSLYFDGKHNIPKDYDKAYEWLQKALENGNKKAKPKLEGLFKLDTGKVVNLNESTDVLQEIANKGNKQARFLYSQRLLKGTGFPQDKAKAVVMLTEDAKQGFVKAQKRLGELYFYGDGVTQDYYEAYAWSMAYAGTKELGGLAREGKQTARSALRKLDDEKHNDAYVKSKEYFEQYVLPFHPNAREVGPKKYRIVVRSRKAQLAQAQKQKQSQITKPSAKTSGVSKPTQTICKNVENKDKKLDRTKDDVALVFDQHKNEIFAMYNRALGKNPNIKGKVEYEIDIDPVGRVTRVDKRVSSTLNASQFEARLVERIRLINFCAKGSKPFTIAFPIDFIPPKDSTAEKTDPALERTMAAVQRSQGNSNNNKEKVVDKLASTVNPNLSTAIQPKPSTAQSTITPGGITTMSVEGGASRAELQGSQVAPTTSASSTDTSLEGASLGSPTGTAQTSAAESSPASGEKARTGENAENSVSGQSKTVTQTAKVKSPSSSAEKKQRSYREIHNVFTRHRTRINNLYLRAYEQDNNLRGRVVFELTIAPSGKVDHAGIMSSDLNSPSLEEELVDYIKSMSFESKNTDPFIITYPLDFLP